jgi:hypothetical protein
MSQSLKQRVVSLGYTACRWIAFGFGYDPIQALLDASAGRFGRNFSTLWWTGLHAIDHRLLVAMQFIPIDLQNDVPDVRDFPVLQP